MEVELARAAIAARGGLPEKDEGALRYALSLARSWHVRGPDGRDVAIAAFLRPLRAKLRELLWPLLNPERSRPAEPLQFAAAASAVAAAAAEARAEVLARVGRRLPAE